jgi:hypothetical protein
MLKALKEFDRAGVKAKAGQDVTGLFEADEVPRLIARGMIAYDRPPEPRDEDQIMPVRPPRRAK